MNTWPVFDDRQNSSYLRRTRHLGLMFLAFLIASCSMGTQFVRPGSNRFFLGSTTYEEIVGQYGKPIVSHELVSDDVNITHLYYAYAQIGQCHEKDIGGGRWMDFYFSDKKLVGYLFRSSLEEDHTDFDENRRQEIIKDRDTKERVVDLYGSPDGEYMYPLVKDKGKRKILYSYSYVKVPFLGKAKTFKKELAFTVDEDELVREINFETNME